MIKAQYSPFPSPTSPNPAAVAGACWYCGVEMDSSKKTCDKCGKNVKSNGLLSAPPPEDFLVNKPAMEFSAQLFDSGITEQSLRQFSDQLKNLKIDQKTITDVTKKLQDSVTKIQQTPETGVSTNTMQNTTTTSIASVKDLMQILADELSDESDEFPEELDQESEDDEIPDEDTSLEIETTEDLEESEDPIEESRLVGEKIGIDWDEVEFTPEDLLAGIKVEMEHGGDAETNVTDDQIEATAKIAWAHLKERVDYYTQLEKMEKESKKAAREEFKVTIVDGLGNELHDEYCSTKELKSVFDRCWKSIKEYTRDPNADVKVEDLKGSRRKFLDEHPSLAS